MGEAGQSKRPWWQFRLRTLLLLMLLVAAYFAGWSAAMRRVRRAELQAREQLQRALEAEQLARQQAIAQRIRAEATAETARLQLDVQQQEVIRAEAHSKTLEGELRQRLSESAEGEKLDTDSATPQH